MLLGANIDLEEVQSMKIPNKNLLFKQKFWRFVIMDKIDFSRIGISETRILKGAL